MAASIHHFPRLCISSTSGGGGKTLLSLGLARAFAEVGIAVKPFKKGPDYIDAAWLSAACGLPCTNLDPFFLSASQLHELFCASMAKFPRALALVEGNRGLFDGLNETGQCSTAQVARAIQCPIVLCIDATKATRTIAAILNGLTAFEDGLLFAGVILNRVGSPRHESSLRRAIEANTTLSVLGALPRLEENVLPERHMGLACQGMDLSPELETILISLGRFVRNHCDLAAIATVANAAPPLTWTKPTPPSPLPSPDAGGAPPPLIGYVRDAALWFYYPENLAALEEAGCRLRPLSLLEESAPWGALDGIYLGGGFPEDQAESISKSPHLSFLRAAFEQGMPIYAECGGLIVLCEALEVQGIHWPMAGIVPAKARWHPRPQGLGYVAGEVVRGNGFYPMGTQLRGHEFHYCDCEWQIPHPSLALRLSRGSGLLKAGAHYDGFTFGNLWASFTHIFAPALPIWAENFSRLARSYAQL